MGAGCFEQVKGLTRPGKHGLQRLEGPRARHLPRAMDTLIAHRRPRVRIHFSALSALIFMKPFANESAEMQKHAAVLGALMHLPPLLFSAPNLEEWRAGPAPAPMPPSPPIPEPARPPEPLPQPDPPPPEIDDPPPAENPVPVHEPPYMPPPMSLTGKCFEVH